VTNPSKHIIIIGPAHPLRGGMANFNERLARAFIAQGHRVTIYTFSLQYPSFMFPGTSQYSEDPAPAGLNIKVVINSVNPFNWLKAGKMLKKENADIIIVRYWLPVMGPALGTVLRMAKKNKRSRVVCIADNVIPHEKRPGDAAFTKYFVKPIDAFITMSQTVMNDLKNFDRVKPVRLVSHPLYDNFGEKVSKQEARQKLGLQLDGPLMLFFGFIRKYKGLDILLDAMKLLRDKGRTDIRLLIAGEFYEDSKPYDEQINRLGIASSLILKTNFIPNNDVKYYFGAADVVLQPYRNATQSGVTPLAYHFEIPMIVTNVGGLPDMVPNGIAGLVAEPTAESLANSIIAYFDQGKDHFLPGLISEKKKYSWDLMVEEILSI